MCRSWAQIQSADTSGDRVETHPLLCASIAFIRVVDIVHTHIYNLETIFDPSGQQKAQLESELESVCCELSRLIPEVEQSKQSRQERNGSEPVGCEGKLSRWLHEFRCQVLTVNREWSQEQRAEYVAWAVQNTPILSICQDVMDASERIRSHNGCDTTRMSIKLGPDDCGNDFGHYASVLDLPMVRPLVLFET